jgi:hypothetical protein
VLNENLKGKNNLDYLLRFGHLTVHFDLKTDPYSDPVIIVIYIVIP